MSSTLLLEAASSSWRSKDRPCWIDTQDSQVQQGSPSSPRSVQFSALARTPCRGGLAAAPRAMQKVGVADLLGAHRGLQGPHDVVLALDLAELLGPVAAVEGTGRPPPPTLDVDSDNPPVSARFAGRPGPARRRPFPGVTARLSAAPGRYC